MRKLVSKLSKTNQFSVFSGHEVTFDLKRVYDMPGIEVSCFSPLNFKLSANDFLLREFRQVQERNHPLRGSQKCDFLSEEAPQGVQEGGTRRFEVPLVEFSL